MVQQPRRPHPTHMALALATAITVFGGRKAQEALDRVLAVAARIDSHEKLCGERWEQLRDSIRGMMAAMENKHAENKEGLADARDESKAGLGEVKAAIGKMWWAIIIGMGGTITFLAGLVVTLALRGHLGGAG